LFAVRLIVLDWLNFSTKIGALENGRWEELGILDGVASISDSTSLAPRALGVVDITRSFRGMLFAVRLIVLNWLNFLQKLNGTKLGALEHSSWESLGVLNPVASISDGTSLAP